MALIEVEHLRKEYPNVTPLKDVNATIDEGEVISIIGPSGTGKSTFLRCLNGLEQTTSGSIRFAGQDLLTKDCNMDAVRRQMGMVFQSFNLFGHKMVAENIMMGPMDLLGVSKQDAYDEAIRLLTQVGLADKALSYPSELSGGQKQRVAIARALAMHPKCILFDEPTSALDPTMVSEVLAIMSELAREGLTMLVVTHEMRFARDASTRVFYMDQGEVWEAGPPSQIFENPVREETRAFIFRVRGWQGKIESHTFDWAGTQGEVESFCTRQFLDGRQTYAIQLLLEEAVQVWLLPAYRKAGIKPDIDINLSCGEGGTDVRARFDWRGLTHDPFSLKEPGLSEEQEISRKIMYTIAQRQRSEQGSADFLIASLQES